MLHKVLCWLCSQRNLTVFVEVLALCYQHHTAHVLCGVYNGVPQLPHTWSESFNYWLRKVSLFLLVPQWITHLHAKNCNLFNFLDHVPLFSKCSSKELFLSEIMLEEGLTKVELHLKKWRVIMNVYHYIEEQKIDNYMLG